MSEDLPLSKMDDPSGSITVTPTGSISLSSSVEFYFGQSSQKEFSWRVGGLLEKEISFEWNVGEGEYYWYRVEGQCGKVNCENSGVDASQCNEMTFVTVVSARNLSEVCEVLNSPRINPPVNLRVSFIKKYSRPVLKGSVPDDQCNTLDEQEFCHIPECLDYCIDETVAIPATMSMTSVDFLELREMTGGFSLSGSSETNRNRRYNPLFPLTLISGSSVCGLNINPASTGFFSLTGSSPITISDIVLDCSGTLLFSGNSRTTSPSYHFSSTEALSLYGSSVARPNFEFGLEQQGGMVLDSEDGLALMTEEGHEISSDSNIAFFITGSSEFLLSANFLPFGSIEVGGMASDYISPSYFYAPSGGHAIGGEAERNFEGLGTIVVDSHMSTTCTDFSSDFNDLSYASGLTISSQTVSPSCGCGPLGLSLLARHNLFGSSILNNFLNKNNKSIPSSISMKYRSSDSSWRYSTNFSGSDESLSIIFSIACMTDVWRLTFSAKKSTQGLNRHTKFIVDMPSDAICSDGSISTRISLGVSSPVVVGIPVVSPAHISTGNIAQSSAVVDGLIFDYAVYYDEIGIFKDSYWLKTPFEIYIEPLTGPEMQSVDLERILS
jgi:hypothetical protein